MAMTTVSAAAQVIIAIIPLVGIFTGGVVVFFFLLWDHRRKVLMIRQGMEPGRRFDLETFSLLSGLLNLGIGFVLTIFFLLKEGLVYGILGGLIPLAIGISLTVFYYIRRKPSPRQ
jgi:hypothetical protein